MKKTTHIITALEELLRGKKINYIPYAKNSNQYFGIIKKQGIELVEVWKPNLTNKGTHKERSLHQTIENIQKAENYLARLKGRIKKWELREFISTLLTYLITY